MKRATHFNVFNEDGKLGTLTQQQYWNLTRDAYLDGWLYLRQLGCLARGMLRAVAKVLVLMPLLWCWLLTLLLWTDPSMLQSLRDEVLTAPGQLQQVVLQVNTMLMSLAVMAVILDLVVRSRSYGIVHVFEERISQRACTALNAPPQVGLLFYPAIAPAAEAA